MSDPVPSFAARFALAFVAFFRVLFDGDDVVFYDGRGWGHGVGMCQYGADGMGQAGYNWRQILAHYYPGSHITRAY